MSKRITVVQDGKHWCVKADGMTIHRTTTKENANSVATNPVVIQQVNAEAGNI